MLTGRPGCPTGITNYHNTPHTTPPTPQKNRECRAEVTRDANRAATDYRLNWRLKRACEADIGRLCAGLCPAGGSAPCGGLVLQCLTERADNVTSPECQEVRAAGGFGLVFLGSVFLGFWALLFGFLTPANGCRGHHDSAY